MATWIVSAGESVQEAIDAAHSGDRIELAAATFPEGIDLGGKSLTLVGAGSSVTTIGGTSRNVCVTTGGGDFTAEGIAFAGCATLLAVEGGSLTFADVELWGSGDPGTVTNTSWTWTGGGLTLLEGGVTASGSTLAWEGVRGTDNVADEALLALDGCASTFSSVEVGDNVVDDYAVIQVTGGTLDIYTSELRDTTGDSRSALHAHDYALSR
jgi:hypothetical protein